MNFKMKKKILFLGRFAPPMHGAAKMNELYFEALKKDKNFEIEKIKLNKYNSLKEIGKFNLQKFKGYLKTISELKNKLRIFNPDIVYVEMAPRGLAFLKDSLFVKICKRKGKKIFIHFHAKGAKYSTKNFLIRNYYKKIFKNTKIILLSKILFEDVKNVLGFEQVWILPNGIKNELTDKEFKEIILKRKKKEKINLLFLSNMIESKGPLDVLKICNELNKKSFNFECNFVGNFQDEEFRKKFERKLKELHLEKRCKYLGPRYGNEKKKILGKTDFLLFPTKYPEETFGLVIIEAFMYGIPVFSYNNASIPEIISKEFLGFVSKKNDWKELENEIEKRFNEKINHAKIRNEFKNKFEFKKSEKKLKGILSG